ncbi:MAG: hypothetical protein D6805_09920 [Planctomycetota bacterium]|nr:MAG: hypothetical protein D6805_09920 [Planctomycetota bacterium]
MLGRLGYIKLEFGPVWPYVVLVRNFVESFMAETLNKDKFSDLIVMAIGELIANAVKYSEGEMSTFIVEVFPEEIRVQTKNKTSPENSLRLQKEIENLRQGDPLEVYTQKLEAILQNPDGRHSLGLIRIRTEVGGDLECKIQGDMVEIFFRCPLKNATSQPSQI